jgi:hypothetical protein
MLSERVESINQSMIKAVVSESEKKRVRLTDIFKSTFKSNRYVILWGYQKVRAQAVLNLSQN